MEEVDMEASSFREVPVPGGNCVCHSKVSSPFGKAAPVVVRHSGNNTYYYYTSGDFFLPLEESWTEGGYADVFNYYEDILSTYHVQFYSETRWQGNPQYSMLRGFLYRISTDSASKRRYYSDAYVQYGIRSDGTVFEQSHWSHGGVKLREILRLFLPLFALQLGYRQPLTQEFSSRWGKQVLEYSRDHNDDRGNPDYSSPFKDVVPVPFEPDKAFLLEEPTVLLDKLQVSNVRYFINAAMQNAYIDTLQRVPVMSENSISNIIELATFVYNIAVNHRIEIPKSLQDGWLKYRYVYTTTKADVKEAVSYVHRSMNLGDLGKGFSCHGSSSFTYKGKEITLRCGLSAREKALNALLDAWTSLYKYGLQPNFYVLWDLVPYSFIVDWVLPVGDTLSAYELIKNTSNRYELSNLWWSMKYTIMYQGIQYTVYSRWNDEPPALNGLYFFESNSGSQKRTICRILDVASLTIK
jgi:hypothetical protein